jgi:hypothetical protein
METLCVQSAIDVPLRIIRQLYTGSAISFASLPPDMCPFIITDKHWLGENLLCLLSNAAKYSNGGAIHVSVSLRAVDSASANLENACTSENIATTDSGPSGVGGSTMLTSSVQRRLRITVTDCGIGVPAELRSQLFQPFVRAHRMAGGTGLGLFSLRKRMDALGGACGVDGRADGAPGSEFWFEFPYRPDPLAGGFASTAALALASSEPAPVSEAAATGTASNTGSPVVSASAPRLRILLGASARASHMSTRHMLYFFIQYVSFDYCLKSILIEICDFCVTIFVIAKNAQSTMRPSSFSWSCACSPRAATWSSQPRTAAWALRG